VVCDLPGAVWRSLKDEPATNDPDEQIYFGGNPVAVAADDDWVFFTDSPDSLMGSVYRLAIDDIGDPNVTPDTVALESEGLSDIAIHNGRVYWIDGSQIWASALDPLDPLPIGQGPNSSGGWGLAFDDIFVYWTVYNGGDVWRATLSGGASQQVAVNANSEGLGIAADCYTIYFGSRTPGSSSIHRVTK
jgi:hypothetical protein